MASRGDRPEVGCQRDLRRRWGALGAAGALVAVVLAWSAPAGHPSVAAVATSPPTAAAAMATPSPTTAPAPTPTVADPAAAPPTRAADGPPPAAARREIARLYPGREPTMIDGRSTPPRPPGTTAPRRGTRPRRRRQPIPATGPVPGSPPSGSVTGDSLGLTGLRVGGTVGSAAQHA
jgi:hypothetical protein